MRRHAALPLIALVAGCNAGEQVAPSLAPRASETIDPRLPVGEPVVIGAPSAALAAELAGLVRLAESGDRAFAEVIGRAEQLAASAGGKASESWVAAQQALSAAVSARGPTTRALGDIDTLAARRVAATGWIDPSDRAAIERTAAAIAAIDRRQAERIRGVESRLGS